MKNRGEHKVLQRKDGKYFIALDITVEEWREMLLNDEVFYAEARDMVIAWYLEENHTTTSKAVMVKYYPDHKGSPYNGIVKKLTNNIQKYLNYRFWVEDSFESGKESFWSIPFEGWYSVTRKKDTSSGNYAMRLLKRSKVSRTTFAIIPWKENRRCARYPSWRALKS